MLGLKCPSHDYVRHLCLCISIFPACEMGCILHLPIMLEAFVTDTPTRGAGVCVLSPLPQKHTCGGHQSHVGQHS